MIDTNTLRKDFTADLEIVSHSPDMVNSNTNTSNVDQSSITIDHIDTGTK